MPAASWLPVLSSAWEMSTRRGCEIQTQPGHAFRGSTPGAWNRTDQFLPHLRTASPFQILIRPGAATVTPGRFLLCSRCAGVLPPEDCWRAWVCKTTPAARSSQVNPRAGSRAPALTQAQLLTPHGGISLHSPGGARCSAGTAGGLRAEEPPLPAPRPRRGAAPARPAAPWLLSMAR